MDFIKGIFTLFFVFVASHFWSQTPDSSSINILDSISLSIPDSSGLNLVDDLVDELIKKDSVKIQDVDIEFVKKHVTQSADSMYFNLCKITNTTSRTIQGNFEVNVPADWNLIGDPSDGIELSPGETKVFPIRLSIPSNIIGGIAYVLGAGVVTRAGNYSGYSYLKVPLHSEWDMYSNNHTIYFNEYFEDLNFDIFIKNKGNANELLKLEFDIGRLLDVVELSSKEIYIEIPAHTDTVLTYTVIRNQLSENDKYNYKKIWKESVIKVTAISGHTKKISESIEFRDLENTYFNRRQEFASPLNIDLSVFNLLTSNQPRVNGMVNGQILFNGDQDLSYVVQGRNLLFTAGSSYFQNPGNFTFLLAYKWKKKLNIQVGEIYNTSMHNLRGWGIKGIYEVNKTNKIETSFISSKYFPGWGISALYETKVKKVGVSIAETYEENNRFFYKAISTQLAASFSPFEGHSVRLALLGTRSVFDDNLGIGNPLDTTLFGFSYSMNYTGTIDKFRIGLSTINDHYNVIRTRPSHNISGNVNYILNAESRIRAIATVFTLKPSRFVNNPYSTGYYNQQQLYKLSYLKTLSPVISIEVGPMSRLLNRFKLDSLNFKESDFSNIFGGVFTQLRIRLGENKVLSPNFVFGYTGFQNKIIVNDALRGMISVTTGLNYTSRNFGASARYIKGPNFFIAEDFFNYDVFSFETVYLRANYGKFIHKRKIKATCFGTYYLRMPSNRQNFVASTRFDFIFPGRWKAYITANLFTNSFDDEQFGVLQHRNFNLNFGVNKSFDIPQPRIKYYELKVICFNDFDGNGERDDNEPLLSNIKVSTGMDPNFEDVKNIRFGDTELITDPEGEMTIVDIPQGNFILKFEPLANLGNLYNSKGDIQEVLISEDLTLYIAYVESYKVKGKIVLKRDEYSSKGLISIGGIRISATTIDGQVYSALSENDGSYVINVPQAGAYTVTVNNIFGEGFDIDKEQYLVQFNGFKIFNVDFTFFEGKRKINFSGGNFFNFGNSANADQPAAAAEKAAAAAEKAAAAAAAEKAAAAAAAEKAAAAETNPESEVETDIETDLDQNSDNLVSKIIPDSMMQNLNDLKNIIDDVSRQNILTINNVDSDKVKFMVEVGFYSGEVPIDIANKMIQLGLMATTIESAGITIYSSPLVPSHPEAINMYDQILDAGFSQAIIVGSYNGKVISEEKAIEYKSQ